MKAFEGFTVVDASGMIAGRLASLIAKRLLRGEKIVIVNAEKAVLSGRRKSRVKEVKEFWEVVGRANPIRGPKHPHSPGSFLRDVVWGMLPRDKPRGREAFRRLKVYEGVPETLSGVSFEKPPEASAEKLRHGYVFLGEICEELGWRKKA
ncbi:MAG: 50S ribosomal protein L13 [Candidatus Hecatellales archaeon B24]|nr:MAG: 50S ribosomal protein L13 [Candidatus Hecatellales archaeon B24]